MRGSAKLQLLVLLSYLFNDKVLYEVLELNLLLGIHR
jgi:hypothetical protein